MMKSTTEVYFHSQISVLVRVLCVKAPSMAMFLTQELLNYSTDDLQAQDAKTPDRSTSSSQLSRRSKRSDRNYRPPKSHIEQHETTRDWNDNIDASGGRNSPKEVSDDCQPNECIDAINQNADNPGVEIAHVINTCQENSTGSAVEEDPQSIIRDHTTCMKLTSHLPDPGENGSGITTDTAQVQSLYTEQLIKDVENACLTAPESEARDSDKATREDENSVSSDCSLLATSSPIEMGSRRMTLPDAPPSTPCEHIARFQSPSSDDLSATPNTILFTPMANGRMVSPLTEITDSSSPHEELKFTLPEEVSLRQSTTHESYASQNNIPSTQPESIGRESLFDNQVRQTIPASSPGDALTIIDMVAQAVHVMHKMTKRQSVPASVHSNILKTLRPNLRDTSAMATIERDNTIWLAGTWSATMWITMLEAGQARSRESTILNMIEWMGASKWYDNELAHAERDPPYTKRGKPRKRLATVILDEHLKGVQNSTVEKSASFAMDGVECHLQGSTEVRSRILDTRRKKLSNIFHKGRTLRRLVEMTHLGVLFDPNIWYVH